MVIKIEDFPKYREEHFPDKTVVCTSGFFDPSHPGHTSCVVDSKEFGDILVVVINGDQQCITKKGKPFIPAKDRAFMIDCLKGVDYVVIYDHPTEYSSLEAFQIIKPDVLTKGGDRDPVNANDPNSPLYKEMKFIESYGGRVEFNVGKPKDWSSSFYLKEWEDFVRSRD